MSDADEPHADHDASLLRVFVLYADTPALDNPLLGAVLEAEFDTVQAADGELVVTHPSLLGATLDGDPAWGMTRIRPAALPDLSAYDAQPLEPAAVLAEPVQATGALCVVEDLPSDMRPARRRAALERVLRCLVAATGARALAWEHSATLTRPDLIGAGHGFVGIRVHPSALDPAGVVVESLGLTPFELPDVWCQARGMDPDLLRAEVARHAAGVLEETEFIADGDPVAVSDDAWFQASWAWGGDPERYIIDLIPDEPHRVVE